MINEKEERRHNTDAAYPEEEVKLAKMMMDGLKTTIEFFHYLMKHKQRSSLTMILLSTDDLKLDHLLTKWKRHTDILFELDKTNNVYVLICQSTDKDGGKQFAEILMSNIRVYSEAPTYCVISGPKAMAYPLQEVIFRMVEKYISIKEEKKADEVFFTNFETTKMIESEDIIYRTELS